MKRRDFIRSALCFGVGALLFPRATEAAWNAGGSLPGVAVRPTRLSFRSLENRTVTDAIIVHHIGNTNADVSAATVHQWHLHNGWSGIGYHFLIRKDGTIEEGRPLQAVGAHCHGENSHTVGINIVGNFEEAEPEIEQMDSAARLIAALCRHYGLTPSDATIFGHRDFNATACPGENLYVRLPELIEGAQNAYIL